MRLLEKAGVTHCSSFDRITTEDSKCGAKRYFPAIILVRVLKVVLRLETDNFRVSWMLVYTIPLFLFGPHNSVRFRMNFDD